MIRLTIETEDPNVEKVIAFARNLPTKYPYDALSILEDAVKWLKLLSQGAPSGDAEAKVDLDVVLSAQSQEKNSSGDTKEDEA